MPISFQSKMLGEERKREFFESAFVQYFLEESGSTLVYIDEFHVSLRNSKLYNWSPRGKSSNRLNKSRCMGNEFYHRDVEQRHRRNKSKYLHNRLRGLHLVLQGCLEETDEQNQKD